MITENNINEEKSRFVQKFLKIFWYSFIGFITFIFLLFWSASNGWLGEIPDVEDLENPDIFVASEIISSDGVVIDKFETEKRIPLKYDELPPHLVNALMAKEDERFYEHSGIDGRSVLRAIFFLGARGGGSTITQQLAKLLYTKKSSQNKLLRLRQKILEWVTCVSLEKRYTKQEIVTMYFNKFDFLFNALGIEMASRVYFNKHAKDLTIDEAAIFVAMLENPRTRNPILNPEKCLERRNVVLKAMKDKNFITESQYAEAYSKPIKVDYQPVNEVNSGLSAYYKEALKKDLKKYLDEFENETGKKYNIYKDGLKIYVTLDSRMQKYAEEAMAEHLKRLQANFFAQQRGRKLAPFYGIDEKKANQLMMMAVKRTRRYQWQKEQGKSEDSILLDFKTPTRLKIFTWKGIVDTLMTPWDSIRYHKHIANAGLMAMDPATGNIKAWVGGISWTHFKYDHVKQARRQVGSTFKPFVYATALRNGANPCELISNDRLTIGKWSPRNSNGRYGGSYTMRDALAYSVNVVAARLIVTHGIDNVIELARELGVESPMPRNYTIALGSSDITIYEMVGAYSTFANYGSYIRPEMVWRIEDANGKIIKEIFPEPKEVLNECVAFRMIELMKGVVEKGTGRGLRSLGITAEVAGKTGTTNENSDGWFIGITPKLATGVWVGWEDRYAHFASTGEGQGAKMAMPIWAYFMKRVYANKQLGYSQSDKFIKPSTGCDDDCSSVNSTGYGEYEGFWDFKKGDPLLNFEEKPNINSEVNKKDEINFDN